MIARLCDEHPGAPKEAMVGTIDTAEVQRIFTANGQVTVSKAVESLQTCGGTQCDALVEWLNNVPEADQDAVMAKLKVAYTTGKIMNLIPSGMQKHLEGITSSINTAATGGGSGGGGAQQSKAVNAMDMINSMIGENGLAAHMKDAMEGEAREQETLVQDVQDLKTQVAELTKLVQAMVRKSRLTNAVDAKSKQRQRKKKGA